MLQMIWEFVVKQNARGQFELAHGPGGAWSKLFARSPGFRGATLLQDTENPLRYLAVELWETETQREQALAERQAEYLGLEAALAEWTESQARVGVFRVRAEATVHRMAKAARPGTAEAGGRRHRMMR